MFWPCIFYSGAMFWRWRKYGTAILNGIVGRNRYQVVRFGWRSHLGLICGWLRVWQPAFRGAVPPIFGLALAKILLFAALGLEPGILQLTVLLELKLALHPIQTRAVLAGFAIAGEFGVVVGEAATVPLGAEQADVQAHLGISQMLGAAKEIIGIELEGRGTFHEP